MTTKEAAETALKNSIDWDFCSYTNPTVETVKVGKWSVGVGSRQVEVKCFFKYSSGQVLICSRLPLTTKSEKGKN